MADKVTNDIMEERLKIGLDMAKKLQTEKDLKLSDYELLDIATRIALSLFIEKNKSYRYQKANE